MIRVTFQVGSNPAATREHDKAQNIKIEGRFVAVLTVDNRVLALYHEQFFIAAEHIPEQTNAKNPKS